MRGWRRVQEHQHEGGDAPAAARQQHDARCHQGDGNQHSQEHAAGIPNSGPMARYASSETKADTAKRPADSARSSRRSPTGRLQALGNGNAGQQDAGCQQYQTQRHQWGLRQNQPENGAGQTGQHDWPGRRKVRRALDRDEFADTGSWPWQSSLSKMRSRPVVAGYQARMPATGAELVLSLGYPIRSGRLRRLTKKFSRGGGQAGHS